MGGVFGRHEASGRSSDGSKLEAKMVEAMQQRAAHGTSVKSFNTIIMKFPKIDESLRKCNSIFEQFGEFCDPGYPAIFSFLKLIFLIVVRQS
jgi:calcium-binding protein CML